MVYSLLAMVFIITVVLTLVVVTWLTCRSLLIIILLLPVVPVLISNYKLMKILINFWQLITLARHWVTLKIVMVKSLMCFHPFLRV